ncbi:uncharacterized protein LOC132562834 [Ylistrum balloti]|uniref:uncharacterized protein LOC132562834 n=1 Tax=Ylistrum balloti TaxID=509963 RepID=UPI002905D6B0|nr:uncharacterized protein LOC132562834 [Ylistrum balloti]XP_060083592.1 uncharacterized protein LOC132562834 [Ylistrum balloti]
MGACYSKSGHDALETPNQKQPHPRHHKNGVAVRYSSPAAQTSLPNSHKSNGGVAQNAEEDKEGEGKKAVVNSGVGVAPSDSGIESLSPSEAEERIGSHTTNSEGKDSGTELCREVDQCAYDPPTAWHSVQTRRGECRTQISSPSKLANRKSDIVILKPSLKKAGEKSDKKYRLSWKSTDSLDWTGTLLTSLDRCQSEASEFGGDDLSIRAPLAEFDSIDFLGSTELLSNKKRTSSFVDYNSETFQFQFDFSGLESHRKYKSCDSAPVTPQSEEPPSVIGAEHVTVDIPHSKRSSRDLRSLRVHFDSEPSLAMYPSLQDVKTMQMDGKEVVVIDVNTYGQIMEELATLKLALSQLTDLMQLQEVEQGGSISDDVCGKLEFSSSPS